MSTPTAPAARRYAAARAALAAARAGYPTPRPMALLVAPAYAATLEAAAAAARAVGKGGFGAAARAAARRAAGYPAAAQTPRQRAYRRAHAASPLLGRRVRGALAPSARYPRRRPAAYPAAPLLRAYRAADDAAGRAWARYFRPQNAAPRAAAYDSYLWLSAARRRAVDARYARPEFRAPKTNLLAPRYGRPYALARARLAWARAYRRALAVPALAWNRRAAYARLCAAAGRAYAAAYGETYTGSEANFFRPGALRYAAAPTRYQRARGAYRPTPLLGAYAAAFPAA